MVLTVTKISTVVDIFLAWLLRRSRFQFTQNALARSNTVRFGLSEHLLSISQEQSPFVSFTNSAVTHQFCLEKTNQIQKTSLVLPQMRSPFIFPQIRAIALVQVNG